MMFAIWDWRKERFWCANALGYTLDPKKVGWYFSNQLPNRAGDCWIAVPRDSFKGDDNVLKKLFGEGISWETILEIEKINDLWMCDE